MQGVPVHSDCRGVPASGDQLRYLAHYVAASCPAVERVPRDDQ